MQQIGTLFFNESLRGVDRAVSIEKSLTAQSELNTEHRGTWRSLVARLTGGQEVAGSIPVVPTGVTTNKIC